VTIILDTGALVAVERGETNIVFEMSRELRAGRPPRTHGGVVGQVWRGGAGRQAWLARHLRTVEILPLDERLGKKAGDLLGRAGVSDVVDAAVVAMAQPGDVILTSDPDDILVLIEAAGIEAEVVPV
jgi:hypothetical protein